MFNENGIYKVLLRIHGEIREIVVDDWIPINAYNEPLFCQLNGNEFWVAIMEKAWAKAHGSYASIIGSEGSMQLDCPTRSCEQLHMRHATRLT